MAEVMTDQYGIREALSKLGIAEVNHGTSTGNDSWGGGDIIESWSPVDGQLIGKVTSTTAEEYEQAIGSAQKAFEHWRNVPAPQRGEVVRQLGRASPRIERASWKTCFLRNGKKPPGRLRRSTGDDRHLRFCSWTFTSVVRFDHAL